jgi:hypothetical protein
MRLDSKPIALYHPHPDLRGQLLQDWLSTHSPRNNYTYPPTLTLNPIFGLPRMQATRIFQMRLGCSYLLTHPVWFRPDPKLPKV